MNLRTLLGIGLAAACTVAACGGGSQDTLSDGSDGTGGDTIGDDGTGGTTGTPGGTTGTPGGTTGGTTGGTPTNSPTGKEYFTSNVYPFLQSGCSACHMGGGVGPTWMGADAAATYALVFQVGFVAVDSPVLNKGPHGGVTTNVLTQAQKNTYLTWVNQEIKDGGVKASPNVLAKLADCLDRTKFDAIGLEDLRTIQRTKNNNTNNVTNWNENANRCTGCNNAPCRDCHSGDDASQFVNAINNPALPKDYTFNQTKLTNPAYLQKYFGVDPTGNPVASNGIENKSIATSKDHAYTHPYFKINAETKAAIQAFVDDAITKYKAGTCTAATPPAP
jgi:hypothetical protein